MTSHSLLRALLARNPQMSLRAIRSAHPVFKAMSIDHLSLRTAKAIDALQMERHK